MSSGSEQARKKKIAPYISRPGSLDGEDGCSFQRNPISSADRDRYQSLICSRSTRRGVSRWEMLRHFFTSRSLPFDPRSIAAAESRYNPRTRSHRVFPSAIRKRARRPVHVRVMHVRVAIQPGVIRVREDELSFNFYRVYNSSFALNHNNCPFVER